MSVTDIKNRNFQSPLNFDFRIDRLTDFNFFVQKVNIPALSLPSAPQGATPFTNIPWPGDHLTFSELSVEFKIDEGMRNWFELFSWMQGIAFPESQSQYGKLVKGSIQNLDGEVRKTITPRANGDIYGQGVLMINSSANNPEVSITFIDLYPVALSEAVFDTTDATLTNLTCVATFKYDYFKVEKVR